MEYRLARADELPALAALTWQMAAEREQQAQPCDAFVPDFVAWARTVEATHTPFVACSEHVIGMAWLARVARTPRPGPVHRWDGDLQTVYVVPEHRDRGVGEALVRTLLAHAWDMGIDAVTVSSSRGAVSLYQRIGFTGLPPYLRITAGCET